MPCKQLIPIGLLIFFSSLAACHSSSSKKGQTPPVQAQPKPTPAPTATPLSSEWGAPVETLVGDWQSTFSDANHFGNISYSIQADGKVMVSLLIYGKGKSQIMAERHEFQGKFNSNQAKIQLTHVKGSCAPKSVSVTLSYSPNHTNPDVIYLVESGSASQQLSLSRIKGGLVQDVHGAPEIRGTAVIEGCFVDGRLNQFLPKQGRG